jgi:probable phosphoglycerate mutase
MQLCFVRHGETDWNLQGRYQGRADPPLCGTGILTARGIAERLAADAQLLIVSSPLQRATATAGLIANALGAPAALIDARLGEIDFGAWQSLTQAQVKLRWPGVLRRWKQDPATFRFPDGESLAEARARLCDFLHHPPWPAEHAGTVVAVSHAGMIRLAGLIAEQRPLAQFRQIEVPSGAIEAFEWTAGGALHRLLRG